MNLDRDQSVGRMIRLAGEREMPSPQAMERAHLAASQAWERTLAQSPSRSRRRFFVAAIALAAAAGISAVALFAWHRGAAYPAAPVMVAKVSTVVGAVALRVETRDQLVTRELAVPAGATLQTGQGRVATGFSDTLSLRLDRHTRVRFDTHTRVTLLEGALYVDSGGLDVGPPLTIVTPAGEVRHVGTQFQVAVTNGATRVRVREGRVLLERGAQGALAMAAGDELEVRGRDARWRHGLPSFGPVWEWSAGLAPALAIEDRPLAEFLTWIAREHGWQLYFADDALQARTHAIRLHGTLQGLDAAAMLERMALVTGVPLEVHEGVLRVGVR
jgi:ferric-dicitrate binding protein FerR (iron transport regulator)